LLPLPNDLLRRGLQYTTNAQNVLA